MLLKEITFKRLLKLGSISYLVICVLTLVLALSCSKSYWGYYFSRPELPKPVYNIKKVSDIVPFQIDLKSEKHFFAADRTETIEDVLRYYKNNSYDNPCYRILPFLEGRNLLPEKFTYDLTGFPSISDLLNKTDLPVLSANGYDSQSFMRGLMVKALDSNNQNLLFLGVVAGQLYNDHYPYYEAVFRMTDEMNFYYISGNRFFFDVAGIEGMEWFVLWIVYCLISLLVIAFTNLIILFLKYVYCRYKSASGDE